MPPPTPLAVATSSINRLLKEETSYEKELVAQQKRLADLTGKDPMPVTIEDDPVQPHEHYFPCQFHKGKIVEEVDEEVGAEVGGDVGRGDGGLGISETTGDDGLRTSETAGDDAVETSEVAGNDDAMEDEDEDEEDKEDEEDVGNKEFKLRQEEQAIEETKKVFGPLREKIEGAVEKVEGILNSGASNDQREVDAAEDAVRRAKGEEGFVFTAIG